MQEDVQQKSVSLIIKGAKLTGRLFQKALRKLLTALQNEEKKIADAIINPKGKQSVKKLVGQNQGVANIDITDPDIRAFESIARKYGVDFAIKKDTSERVPKHLVFFKARDADALQAALKEFSVKKINRAKRPSMLAQLREMKAAGKDNAVDRVRSKAKEQAR